MKVFVITTSITMSYLHDHPTVHGDVNVTIVLAIVAYFKIQAEVKVVIGGRGTSECRGVRVVGAACVSHHTGERNDVTSGRSLEACGVSRETNEICKSVRYTTEMLDGPSTVELCYD